MGASTNSTATTGPTEEKSGRTHVATNEADHEVHVYTDRPPTSAPNGSEPLLGNSVADQEYRPTPEGRDGYPDHARERELARRINIHSSALGYRAVTRNSR